MFTKTGYSWLCITICSAILPVIGWLAMPATALADEGHGEAISHVPAYLVQIGIYTLLVIVIGTPLMALYLNRLSRGPKPLSRLGGYLYQVSLMSRNAKLFLLLSLFSFLGQSVWTVLFNLYLLALGFDVKYVGIWLTINMVFHGAFALPSGVVADHIGRKNTFLLATILQVVSRSVALFTLNPTALLVLAGVIGLGDGAHAVAGAPFMMENSRPEERPHLFGIEASLTWISRMLGSVLGGVLPIAMATTFNVAIESPEAARFALLVSLPITLMGVLPLYFINEKRPPPERREKLSQFFRLGHMKNARTIGLLAITTVFFGFGFGFTVPFFNVFFHQAFTTTPDQVGFILALASVAGAVASPFSPMIIRRWGKVKGMFVSQLASFPLLMLLGLMPNLPSAIVFFFLWRSAWSFSMPIRNQFSMEVVSSHERGTTNGLLHGVMDLIAAPAAAAAGLALATGNYFISFGIASVSFIIGAFLWLAFFSRLERQVAVAEAATV